MFFLLVYSLGLSGVFYAAKACTRGSVIFWETIKRPRDRVILIISLLSLSGMPPFAGFYAKSVVISYRICVGNRSRALVALVFSIFFTYVYINFFYSKAAFSGRSPLIRRGLPNRAKFYVYLLAGAPLMGLAYLRVSVSH